MTAASPPASRRPLIYLADLSHVRRYLGATVPLNIGSLACAADALLDGGADIRLFKYPRELDQALDQALPDILGLSNYMWNSRLSLHYAERVKAASPRVFTVMGGPHARPDAQGLESFLRAAPFVDAYIPLQGETPFARLALTLAQTGFPDRHALRAARGSLPGVRLNVEEYPFEHSTPDDADRNLRYGSAYLKGFLDGFLADATLFPVIETNRGCPHRCAYCSWGVDLVNRVRRRPLDVVLEELDYIREHCAGQDFWIVADANFGMFQQDEEVARAIDAMYRRHGFPRKLSVNWTKGRSDRLNRIIATLNGITPAQVAVQSFDQEVLQDIGRKNLDSARIGELLTYYRSIGASTSTDLLAGGGRETFASHLQSIRTAFDLGFDFLQLNNIFLLPGTAMDSQAYRQRYGVHSQFRRSASDFGIYHGRFVAEYEECLRATSSLSLQEMNRVRVIHFLVYTFWNMPFFRKLLDACRASGLNPLDALLRVEALARGTRLGGLLDAFAREAEQEFFDTVEALDAHYADPDRRRALLEGKAGKLVWNALGLLVSDVELLREAAGMTVRALSEHAGLSTALADALVDITLRGLCTRIEDAAKETRSYTLEDRDIRWLEAHRFVDASPSSGLAIAFSMESARLDQLRGMLARYGAEEDRAAAFAGFFSVFDPALMLKRTRRVIPGEPL